MSRQTYTIMIIQVILIHNVRSSFLQLSILHRSTSIIYCFKRIESEGFFYIYGSITLIRYIGASIMTKLNNIPNKTLTILISNSS